MTSPESQHPHAGPSHKIPGISEQLAEYFGMSDEAKIHVRERMIASAYAQLPFVSAEMRKLARDRMLAAECGLWRVRFREMEKECDHQRRRAEMLEREVTSLSTRLNVMLNGLSTELPPEFTGVSTTG
jgi:hypothetical protein